MKTGKAFDNSGTGISIHCLYPESFVLFSGSSRGRKMLVSKKKIAQRIQKIMREIGVTQQELADLLGISQPAISIYLKGRMPPPDVLLQIARLGETTVEWLLTGEKESVENPFSLKEKRPVYGNQTTLLILWKQLPENIQRDLLTLMRHMAEIQEEG